nr:MAG TPA: hypothetical protein [Caudoviricetes sp.]
MLITHGNFASSARSWTTPSLSTISVSLSSCSNSIPMMSTSSAILRKASRVSASK